MTTQEYMDHLSTQIRNTYKQYVQYVQFIKKIISKYLGPDLHNFWQEKFNLWKYTSFVMIIIIIMGYTNTFDTKQEMLISNISTWCICFLELINVILIYCFSKYNSQLLKTYDDNQYRIATLNIGNFKNPIFRQNKSNEATEKYVMNLSLVNDKLTYICLFFAPFSSDLLYAIHNVTHTIF